MRLNKNEKKMQYNLHIKAWLLIQPQPLGAKSRNEVDVYHIIIKPEAIDKK